MRQRLALLLMAVLTALGVRTALADPRMPAERIRAEVAAIASAVAADGGADVAYASTSTSLNVIRGRAWILTLAVGDAPQYGGEYFILSDIDGKLVGELMSRPLEPSRVLTGEELTGYLLGVDLDYAPIRVTFERYFRGPAPPPARR